MTQMLRLGNRLHDWRGGRDGGSARLRGLLEGVCGMVRASAGVLVVGEVRRAEDAALRWGDLSCLHLVGADARFCDALIDSGNGEASLADPAIRKLLRRVRRRAVHAAPLTLTRRELLDDEQWYAHEHVRRVRRLAGIDDCVYSARILEGGTVACLCACRLWGDRRPFDARDARTVHVLHAECGWVYRDELPSDRVKALPLSPREQQVLWKLLSGRAEKQIATEMRLSPNTVHHYVKAIYRRLRVSSRGELLARWMGRGVAQD